MKFNDLSIQEKAAVIKLGVGGGLRSLLDIQLFWDSMPDDPPGYYEQMEKVANENYHKWGYNNPDEALVHALNDNTYDYRGFYRDNPNAGNNAETHWPDTYKTVYHPTFSNESRYSGIIDRNFNPEGKVGGRWNGDNFIPAKWQNKYAYGGPKKKLKSPELILTEKYSIEPVTADNTNFIQQPIVTPQEKSYAAALLAFFERHKFPEAEEKALREARLIVKDLKAAEFGTLDTPLSNNLQYAWRRFNNSKGTELLYPLPGVGEAMFGVDVADKLYNGNYSEAAKDLALYGAMTYAPEIKQGIKNITIAKKINKLNPIYNNQIAYDFDYDRINAYRNTMIGNNYYHGTFAKPYNVIWEAGSYQPVNANFDKGMFVSFGLPWGERINSRTMYIFPESTFGRRLATDYRGNVRQDEYVNDIGKLVSDYDAGRLIYNIRNIHNNPRLSPESFRLADYDFTTLSGIKDEFGKYGNLKLDHAKDIFTGNQTVIPKEQFNSALLTKPYRIHYAEGPNSALIEFNPNAGNSNFGFSQEAYENFVDDFINGKTTMFSKGGSIHIKPENRGKFNATKRRTGKTTEELTHSKNPITRKRAIFAQNARKWHHKHAYGGPGDGLDTYMTPEQIDNARYIWDYITGQGISPRNAAVLMGNAMKESSLNPQAKNPNSSAFGYLLMIDTLRKKADKYIRLNNLDKDLGLFDYYNYLIQNNIDDYMKEYNRVYNEMNRRQLVYDSNPTDKNKTILQEYVDYYDKIYGKRVSENRLFPVSDLKEAYNNPKSTVKELTPLFEETFMKSNSGAEHDKRVKYAYDFLDYFAPDERAYEAMRNDPLNYDFNGNYRLEDGAYNYALGGPIKPFSYLPIPEVRY